MVRSPPRTFSKTVPLAVTISGGFRRCYIDNWGVYSHKTYGTEWDRSWACGESLQLAFNSDPWQCRLSALRRLLQFVEESKTLVQPCGGVIVHYCARTLLANPYPDRYAGGWRVTRTSPVQLSHDLKASILATFRPQSLQIPHKNSPNLHMGSFPTVFGQNCGQQRSLLSYQQRQPFSSFFLLPTFILSPKDILSYPPTPNWHKICTNLQLDEVLNSVKIINKLKKRKIKII